MSGDIARLDMDIASNSMQQTAQNEVHTAEDKKASQSYKKAPGFASTKGQAYEWKIAALLFLRGLNSDLQFELAVNVADAGAFDDIIFRFKTREDPDDWVICFIHVKHKERNKYITRNMLTDRRGILSLPSYLQSYVGIRDTVPAKKKNTLLDGKFGKSWFILFCNGKPDDNLVGGRDYAAGGTEGFLWTNQGKIFCNGGFASDVHDCFGPERVLEGEAFLSQFKFFCGQANEKDLEDLITDELLKSQYISNRASDIPKLCRIYIAEMKEWWETTGSSRILNQRSDLLQVANDKTLLEVCSLCEGKAYQMPLEIRFNESTISEMQYFIDNNNFVHFVPSEPSFKLSYTKLIQAVENETYSFFGIESMIPYKQHVLKEWNSVKNKRKTLIFDFRKAKKSDLEETLNFFHDLCKLLVKPAARIVILADKTSALVDAISKENSNKITMYEDIFQTIQLEEESLRFISCNVRFKLQGYWTKLGNFPDMSDQSSVGEKQVEAALGLDGSLLVEIVENGSHFSVGAPLPESIAYYVARTMDQFTVLKPSIFNVSSLAESISIRHATMKYVRSILAKTANPERIKESLDAYSRSPLRTDSKNSEVCISDNFMLGNFVCNFIGFQSQHDQIKPYPAFRIRRINSRSLDQEPAFKWFLFIFDHCTGIEESLLWKHHEVKHFLRLENEMLMWTNSVGDIKVIRPHIDEVLAIPTVNPETATCVDDRRVVLLCAEPGIGKSTLMTRLAKKTKEAHSNLWIILLSLSDHTHLFADGKHKDAVGFLLAASGIEKNSAEESLFKIAIGTVGNVVVLLDGYDEIAPKYIEECCVLLTNIINTTKVHKIWITSRISMKDTLEVHLSTLAVNLRKFNEDDQRRFLKQYWLKDSKMSESVLDAFISNLIKITSQTIRDQEKDFMGIPLQTKIMAEVFKDKVIKPADQETVPTEMSNKLDLLDLLQKFVDKKLVVYYENKLNMKATGAGYERFVSNVDKKSLYDGHKIASLILILSDDEIKELHPKTILADSKPFLDDIKTSAEKTGIIDGIVNDKPRFVHRVFAEFFMAQWFVEHLQDNVHFLKNKLYTPEYAVILNFFDRTLVKKHSLHTAVLDADLEEVERLLDNGVDVYEVDEVGRTALHLAATLGSSKNKSLNDGNIKILEILMEKSPQTINTRDTIMCCTPLWYADTSAWWRAVDRLMTVSGLPDDYEQYLVKTISKIKDGAMLGAIVTEDLVELLNFCLKRGLSFDANTLQSAFEHGSSNVALILIDKGADI